MEHNGTVHKIFIEFKKAFVHLRCRLCLLLSMRLVHPRKYPVNGMYSYLTESLWKEMIRKIFLRYTIFSYSQCPETSVSFISRNYVTSFL